MAAQYRYALRAMGVRVGRPAVLLLCLVLAGCERKSDAQPAPGTRAEAPAAPPLPSELATLDPLLRAAIEQHAAAVRAEPGSAAAWRALGELYHANGFYGEAERAFA